MTQIEFLGLGAEDLARNAEFYAAYTRRGNPNAWDSGNPTADQRANFDTLVTVTELSRRGIAGTSCLDIGCGTGDFYKYWKEHGGGDYHGIDIFDPSVQTARAAYPEGKFEMRDLLATPPGPDEKYDYVFLSGSLSLKLRSIDNYDFMRGMIQYAAQMANHGVAFNFPSAERPPILTGAFFYRPSRVFMLCGQVAPDFDFRIQQGPEYQLDAFLTRRRRIRRQLR